MLDDQTFRQLLGDHPHAVSIYHPADPKQVDTPRGIAATG